MSSMFLLGSSKTAVKCMQSYYFFKYTREKFTHTGNRSPLNSLPKEGTHGKHISQRDAAVGVQGAKSFFFREHKK